MTLDMAKRLIQDDINEYAASIMRYRMDGSIEIADVLEDEKMKSEYALHILEEMERRM